MTKRNFFRFAILFALAAAAVVATTREHAATAMRGGALATASPAAQAEIDIRGFYAANRVQQGRAVQAAVVIDVPEGYHIVGNRKVETFIPTTAEVKAPAGVRVGPIAFPRGVVRQFDFGTRKVSVPFYEGRNILRFNVTFPANFQTGETELRARVRYQACKGSSECYPPATREITMPISVVSPDEPVKRINTQFFGGRK